MHVFLKNQNLNLKKSYITYQRSWPYSQTSADKNTESPDTSGSSMSVGYINYFEFYYKEY